MEENHEKDCLRQSPLQKAIPIKCATRFPMPSWTQSFPQDETARVACETTVTTGMVLVAGEISTTCYVDIPKVVRDTVREIGYTRAKYGFDAQTCAVLTAIDEQSADIALGVDEALSIRKRATTRLTPLAREIRA